MVQSAICESELAGGGYFRLIPGASAFVLCYDPHHASNLCPVNPPSGGGGRISAPLSRRAIIQSMPCESPMHASKSGLLGLEFFQNALRKLPLKKSIKQYRHRSNAFLGRLWNGINENAVLSALTIHHPRSPWAWGWLYILILSGKLICDIEKACE
jgi:hypothetical protein